VELFDGGQSKGQATAGADGTLTKELTDLAVGSHALKAKALYGDGAESVVRGFAVAAVVAPTISSIKAASGAEIPAGGITVETSVTVTGAASAGLEVEVFDGSASKSKATANTNGQWALAITSLADGAHSIKARALYGDGVYSQVYGFTVIPSVAPTLDSIKDSRGQEIPRGGSTSDTRVTIRGTATSHQAVEVFDWDQSKGQATADSDGKWKHDFTSLTVGAHSALAKALYGNGGESYPRSFSVVAPAALTIYSITDASGVEIPDGSVTTSK
jgi:hypothetical protein